MLASCLLTALIPACGGGTAPSGAASGSSTGSQGLKGLTTDSQANVLFTGLLYGPTDFGGGAVIGVGGEDTFSVKLAHERATRSLNETVIALVVRVYSASLDCGSSVSRGRDRRSGPA